MEVAHHFSVYGYGEAQPTSTQDYVSSAQKILQDRYQEYSPTYNQGDVKTDLIPLSSISKVPISMWHGMLDTNCSNDKTVWAAGQIGERVQELRMVPWGDHHWWGGAALGNALFDEIALRLKDPEYKTYPLTNSEFLQ